MTITKSAHHFTQLLLAFFVMQGSLSIAGDHYGYPIKNPLAATVIGTPTEYEADLGKFTEFKTLQLKVYKDRVTPKYFWYNDKITYGLLAQKKQSPLIFIVAGTGGNYTGPKIKTLSQAYFNAGYHVVTLPSPTYMSFIIAASNSTVPGLLDDDSHDLYNVMKLAWNTQLKERIDVSDFYITGYSLGGAQAAYLTYIDEQQKFFNFKKALILNTPVSLINSLKILDGYVTKHFPLDHAGEKFNEFWKSTWALIAERYAKSTGDELALSPDSLFELYKHRELDNQSLEALIAVAFRMSAASMIFTADSMSKSGFIVPAGKTTKVNVDVINYFVIAHRTGFNEYAKQLMLPYYQKRDPNITFETLVERASLYPLEEYLRNSEKISLMHNEDDIIMAAGEIDWLKDVFGDRAKFYPHGGHLGNVAYKDNITYMINYFNH